MKGVVLPGRSPGRIVAIDDQPEVRSLLADFFRARGRELVAFSSGEEAIARFAREEMGDVELCVLDLDLGAGRRGGLDVLVELRRRHPQLPVVILTGNATVDAAVRAVKAGAEDFVVKDLYLEDNLALSVERIERAWQIARDRSRLEDENAELREQNHALRLQAERRARLVGESAAVGELLARIERVAKIPRPVLILGERGTGKELVASAVHRFSPRAGKPFITINCAAVTETLLESELFGHEPGAFTGATRRKEGKFELADGGTLFLDEIGNMSPEFQSKILRVLEYQRFERVAGSRTLHVDVRVIAATNEDLEGMMARGAFRRDLYDRLAFEVLVLPPLRERKEDIPALAAHFLALFREEVPGIACRELSPDAVSLLLRQEFPGNVRDLKNVIERAASVCDGVLLGVDDVAAALATAGVRPRPDAGGLEAGTLPERVAAYERRIVVDALDHSGWNQREAAVALGLTYDQLRHLYRKYGLREGRG